MVETFCTIILLLVMLSWAMGAFIASHMISKARREDDELIRMVDESVEEAIRGHDFEDEYRDLQIDPHGFVEERGDC